MSQRKEAIELLVDASREARTLGRQSLIAIQIDKALALLREEPECKTCGDTGEITRTFTGSLGLETPWRAKGSSKSREDEIRPCPDCKAEEPEKSKMGRIKEAIKKLNKAVKVMPHIKHKANRDDTYCLVNQALALLRAEEPEAGKTREMKFARSGAAALSGSAILDRLLEACDINDRLTAELNQILDVVEIAVNKELISCAESEHRKGISPEYISALEAVRDKIKEKQGCTGNQK